jgi:hypothetical protein
MTLVELFEFYAESIGGKARTVPDDCGCQFIELTDAEGAIKGFGIQTSPACAEEIAKHPPDISTFFAQAA